MTPRDATSGPPRLEIEGRIARVTLERPEQHNALEAVDIDVLRRHLDAVDADPEARVLVLTGSGPATFCAGASLRQLESGEITGERFSAAADRLAVVRVPTVCALNGSAYGGGVELALCCDFRVGVHGSRIAVPAARLGLCYPVAGLIRFVDALGLGTATRLLVGAEELDAEAMLASGFLHRLVSPEELDAAADVLAEELAALAPRAVQAMKRILGDHARGTLDAEAAHRLARDTARSTDFAEGLRARREDREADFRGT